MTEQISNGKPLTVNPLKVSQPMGASLALLGVSRTMPLEHGAQGCTAFSKVFFTRHFREPIPLQTTAVNHMVTVMGADDAIVEALNTIASAEQPALIGLVTTGLTEVQGADIHRSLQVFRQQHPEWAGMPVVPVNAPDTLGSLESGFALAVEGLIAELVPPSNCAGQASRQINVLASSMLTPGDLDALKTWIEAFGLLPVVLPDLSGSLDGHLDPAGFSNLTQGGITVAEIAGMGAARATLVIGASLYPAADLLHARTGVPDYRFAGLMGLAACDALTERLAEWSGRSRPAWLGRQRSQLMDAMVDCHMGLGGMRVALAGEPDGLAMLARFVASVGAEVCVAVSPVKADWLDNLPLVELHVGDLEDLEAQAGKRHAQLLLANSHGVPVAARLGIPILRTGFPIHDVAGAPARQWIGYAGSRQTLFDLYNLLIGQRQALAPYRSIFWQGGPRDQETAALALA